MDPDDANVTMQVQVDSLADVENLTDIGTAFRHEGSGPTDV